MKTSEEIDKIAAALVKFQSKVESPKKTAENPAFKREGKNLKYADLDAIIKAVTPILAENGLSQHQLTGTDMEAKAVHVTTMLLHESGQYITSDTLMLPADSFGKFNAQTIGSAITYGRRYSLSALLGIASENDDDANDISGQGQNNQPQNQNKQSYQKKSNEPRGNSMITPEQKEEILNLVREYAAARGMADEQSFIDMLAWIMKAVNVAELDKATMLQAATAITKLKQAIEKSQTQ